MFDIGGLDRLGNPVRKSGCLTCGDGNVNNRNDHLAFYGITGTYQASAIVANQFGEQTISIRNPIYLAVPTQKAEGPLPDPIVFTVEHFKCYEVVNGAANDVVVDLEDQFGIQEDVVVGPPIMFCNPATKNDEAEIIDTVGHLTCYQITGTFGPRVVNIRNQFNNDEEVNVTDAQMLCVPSVKLSFTPGPG